MEVHACASPRVVKVEFKNPSWGTLCTATVPIHDDVYVCDWIVDGKSPPPATNGPYQFGSNFDVFYTDGDRVNAPDGGRGWYVLPGTAPPAGLWRTPDDGSSVAIGGNLHLEMYAFAGAGVRQVVFSARLQGSNETPTLLCPAATAPAHDNVYLCDWRVNNVSTGDLIISADVYDLAGTVTPSSGGVRTIHLAGITAGCVGGVQGTQCGQPAQPLHIVIKDSGPGITAVIRQQTPGDARVGITNLKRVTQQLTITTKGVTDLHPASVKFLRGRETLEWTGKFTDASSELTIRAEITSATLALDWQQFRDDARQAKDLVLGDPSTSDLLPILKCGRDVDATPDCAEKLAQLQQIIDGDGAGNKGMPLYKKAVANITNPAVCGDWTKWTDCGQELLQAITQESDRWVSIAHVVALDDLGAYGQNVLDTAIIPFMLPVLWSNGDQVTTTRFGMSR